MGLFSVNRMLTGNFFLIGHPSKQTELEYTKLDASFVLDLFLEGGSKLGKALVGHDVKDIDILVLDAFTVLVHAQAQATAHLLAAGKGGLLLDQGADLKHVGVVPAFPQRRVGENKPQRTLKAEKPLLVPHDGVVGVIVGLGVALGVLQASFLVLREVAVMYLAHICGESLSEERILGLCDQLLIALLKHSGVDAGCAVLVAVLVHLIDEEQGQYLDPLVQIPQLFVKVGFDGAPDLRLLDDVLVHVSNGLAQLDLLGIAKLDMFKIGSAVNSGNGVAFVQFPPAGQQE